MKNTLCLFSRIGKTLFVLFFLSISFKGYTSDIKLGSLVSALNEDGRCEVFSIGADGNVYHRWQLAPESSVWSNWTLNVAGHFSKIDVKPGHNKKLYLFGIDDGVLIIRQQVAPNGGWAEETLRTGSQIRDICIAYNYNNRFEILAIGGDEALWAFSGIGSQGFNADSWSPWIRLNGKQLQKIVAARDGDGRVNVVALGQGR